MENGKIKALFVDFCGTIVQKGQVKGTGLCLSKDMRGITV
jgi:hypothetical protein